MLKAATARRTATMPPREGRVEVEVVEAVAMVVEAVEAEATRAITITKTVVETVVETAMAIARRSQIRLVKPMLLQLQLQLLQLLLH